MSVEVPKHGGHVIYRCRHCRGITARCRCPGPHETVWTDCDPCKQLIAAGWTPPPPGDG